MMNASKLEGSDKLPARCGKANLQVHSLLTELEKVLSWFEQLHQKQIPKEVWLKCELALAEGFTNVVRYAHKDKPSKTPIDMEVTMLPDCIEIRIWDYGAPFDLKGWLKQQLLKPNTRPGGGQGIKLMEAIADDLSYTRTSDGRNCLLIVKGYFSDSEAE